jgi:feruloyl-CoA synthase
MFFYSGAALAQPIWDLLHEVQEQEIGERIVMGTGLGMTESSPFACSSPAPTCKSGHIGLPTPAWSSSWCPPTARPRSATRARTSRRATGAIRRRPPSASTTKASSAPATPCCGSTTPNPHLGLKFDGRIAEDFKLATGTFVSVGPLRAKIIAAGAPYVQDAVITGLNRNEVGALLFPTPPIRQLAGLPDDAPLQQCWKARRCRRTSSRCSTRWRAGHRQRQPRRAAAPAARAALHRQGRGHRQGLHQPARRAQAPRRAGAGLPRRPLPFTLKPQQGQA